jgi:hypothetical protein
MAFQDCFYNIETNYIGNNRLGGSNYRKREQCRNRWSGAGDGARVDRNYKTLRRPDREGDMITVNI